MGDILDSSRCTSYKYQSTDSRYKKVQHLLSARLSQKFFIRWKRSCYIIMVVLHSKSSQKDEEVIDRYQSASASPGEVSSRGGTVSTEILSPQCFESPSPLRPPPPPPPPPPSIPLMPSSGGLSLIPVAKGTTTQFSSSVTKTLKRRGNYIDGSQASSSFKSRQLTSQQGASTFLLPSIETLNFVESLPLPLSESTSPIPVVDLTYFTTPSGSKQQPLASPDIESGTLSGSTTLATMTHTSCTTAPYTPLATRHHTRPKGSPSKKQQQPLLVQQHQQQQQQLFEADSHATSREYLVDQIFKYWSALAQQPETLGSDSHATHFNTNNTDSSKSIVMSIAVKKWLKYARSKRRSRERMKQIDDRHIHQRLRSGYLQMYKFMFITTHTVSGSQTVPKREQRRIVDNLQRCFVSRNAFLRILSRTESTKKSHSNVCTSLLGRLYLCFKRFRVRLAHHTTRVALAKGSISIHRLGYLSQVKRALCALAANVRLTSDDRVDVMKNSASIHNESFDSLIIDASRMEEEGGAVISSLSGSEVDLTFSSNSLEDNPLQYGVKNETAEVSEREMLMDSSSINSRNNTDTNDQNKTDTVDDNTGQKTSRLNIILTEKESSQNGDRVVRSPHGSLRNTMAVSRYVRVLWDIENVQVPKRVSGLSLVESLQKTLSSHPPHALCGPGVDLRITAFLRPNESHSSADLLHQLDLAAVEMVLVAKKREDADRKLGVRIQQEMQVLRPDITTFVLISSDTDFRHHLQLLKNNGFEVVVIHNIRTELMEHSSWKQTFDMHASRCYRWKDIVDTARQPPRETDENLDGDDGIDTNQATTTGIVIDGDGDEPMEVSRVDIAGSTISKKGPAGQGSAVFYCGVCRKRCNSRIQLDAHNSSAKHMANCAVEGKSPNSKGVKRNRKQKVTKDTTRLEPKGDIPHHSDGDGDGAAESPCAQFKNSNNDNNNNSSNISVENSLDDTVPVLTSHPNLSGSEYTSPLPPSPNLLSRSPDPAQLDVSSASIEMRPIILESQLLQKSQNISQDNNNETAGSLSSSNIHVLCWESHSPLWKRAVAFYSHVRKVSALFAFLKHTTLSRIRKERDGHIWQRWRRRKLLFYMQRFNSVYRKTTRSHESYNYHHQHQHQLLMESGQCVRFGDGYKSNVLLDRKDDGALKVGITSLSSRGRERSGYHNGVVSSSRSSTITRTAGISITTSSNNGGVNGEILKSKVRSESESFSSPYQCKSVCSSCSREASLQQATKPRHTLL